MVLVRVQGLDAQGQADLVRAVYFSARTPSPKALPCRLIARASASGGCLSGSDEGTRPLSWMVANVARRIRELGDVKPAGGVIL